MRNLCYAFICSYFVGFSVQAQQVLLQGNVVDTLGNGIAGVSIYEKKNPNIGATTDSLGRYSLEVYIEDSINVVFQHISYFSRHLVLNIDNYANLAAIVVLKQNTNLLDELEIYGKGKGPDMISVVQLSPLDIEMLPSPFHEFSKVLSTLPGVVSNNEFSSAYAVRGGNFDENLVYVNGIPIYRPFLIRSGQQEGLSFVNPDLVSNISFSAGGWQPKYGDKLSSSLSIAYDNPKENLAGITVGLLGGAAYATLYDQEGGAGALVGVRHKNSQYLLNTLETKGEYLPSFTDVQVLLSKPFGQNNRTSVELLASYARNRYLVKPVSQETFFGTFSRTMRLNVYFEGNELMEYDTYQTGLKLSHLFSQRFVSDVILSGYYTLEREYYDIEGAYRICDINLNPGNDQSECLTIRGVGSNYRYARNRLAAKTFNAELRNTYYVNSTHLVEFGAGVSLSNVDDFLNEYQFSDSSDFITLNSAAYGEADISAVHVTAYAQHTTSIDPKNTLTYGVRLNYRDLNDQLLVSPRLQYAFSPTWEREVVFRAAVGLYQQPPFYRELRDRDGYVKRKVRAQSSWHNIVSLDYNFKMWGRDFKWVTEAYYKYMWNIIPYEVDNVRIRYAAHNRATAYAAGFDVRISGEFIEGAQSWFSLGILTTEEDLQDDEHGYRRRPSDQRVNLGVYFQDHIPNDPSIRMYLSLLVGTGLPFGPPNNEEYRNAFTGKAYRRVDIGFSKIFDFEEKHPEGKLKSLWISAEILNLMNFTNVLSYSWIEDVNRQQFAVPNSLSTRFLNIKLTGKF